MQRGKNSSFNRPEILRPPSEWRSYYLPVTSGCSNNTCGFCAFYGSKLSLRDIAEVKREIDALSLYVRGGLRVPGMPDIVYAIARQWDGRQVFLQDGDALVYPYNGLIEILDYLNSKFPHIERVAAYATVQDILRRTPLELQELRQRKLGILYLGVESGDNDVLQKVVKGVDYDQMVEAGRKVKDAGMLLSVSVILGLGGVAGSEKHAHETARILTDIDPQFAGALTLTMVSGTPVCDAFEKGDFELITPLRSLEELKIIVEEARFTDCFFSSMHASNYFSVRGKLPAERENMLNELQFIISRRDPAFLRPEYLRGL